MLKRNTVGLLYANRIDKAGLAEDKAQEALDAPDALEPILEEAFEWASHPDDFMTRPINLTDFLRHIKEKCDEQM